MALGGGRRRRGRPETTSADHEEVERGRRVRSLELGRAERRGWSRGLRAGDVGVLMALERRAVSVVARLLRLSDLALNLAIVHP